MNNEEMYNEFWLYMAGDKRIRQKHANDETFQILEKRVLDNVYRTVLDRLIYGLSDGRVPTGIIQEDLEADKHGDL